MVQQNPALIQPLIQQLAQSNPALAQQLASNPEALYALLGGAGGGEGGEFGEDEWEQGDFGDDGEGGEGGGPNNVVSVTEDERAAIARVSRTSCSTPFARSEKPQLTRFRSFLSAARGDGLRAKQSPRGFPSLRPKRGDGRQLPLRQHERRINALSTYFL